MPPAAQPGKLKRGACGSALCKQKLRERLLLREAENVGSHSSDSKPDYRLADVRPGGYLRGKGALNAYWGLFFPYDGPYFIMNTVTPIKTNQMPLTFAAG